MGSFNEEIEEEKSSSKLQILKPRYIGGDTKKQYSTFLKELQAKYEVNRDLLESKVDITRQPLPDHLYTGASKNFLDEIFKMKIDTVKGFGDDHINDLFDEVLMSFPLLDNVKEPIQFKACENSLFKNVVLTGEIGNGKSSTDNKLAHVL